MTFTFSGSVLQFDGVVIRVVIGTPASKFFASTPLSIAAAVIVSEIVFPTVPSETVMTALLLHVTGGVRACAWTRVIVMFDVGVSVAPVAAVSSFGKNVFHPPTPAGPGGPC